MRLSLPERLAFWKRHQPVDLSCISREDWERLERASHGDERELTARIMLLAYLAKANGHSTYDAMLPPDLTPQEANRLADQLVIGDESDRVGAPGRRGKLRVVAPKQPAEAPQLRKAPPKIFRFFQAFSIVLVSLAALASPWALSQATDTVLIVLAFSLSAYFLRGSMPFLSVTYGMFAAGFAEGVLRAALPVDVRVGAGPLFVMVIWTILIQPRFQGQRLLRGFGWFAIGLCALLVPAEWFGANTYALWALPFAAAAITFTMKAARLGLWKHPLTIINLLPLMVMVAVVLLDYAFSFQYGDMIIWITNALFLAAPIGTCTYAWRRARVADQRFAQWI